MLDGVAQGGDDAAIRNVSLDPIGRERLEEIRTYLGDLTIAGGIAKMMRVPIDALVVERVEELRLLNAVRQIDAALEHAMQPGGAGTSRTGANDLWQLAVHRLHPRARRFTASSCSLAARGFFHDERSIASSFSSASTSGRKRSRSRSSCWGVRRG